MNTTSTDGSTRVATSMSTASCMEAARHRSSPKVSTAQRTIAPALAVPHLAPHRAVRRDQRAQHDHTVAGEEVGDEADPAHVLVPVGAGEPEPLRQVRAHDVAVEHLDPPALVEQPLLEGTGDRRLARR